LEKSSAYRESPPLSLQNPQKNFKIETTFVGGHRAGKTADVPGKYVLSLQENCHFATVTLRPFANNRRNTLSTVAMF
jgi:hypothetical protein